MALKVNLILKEHKYFQIPSRADKVVWISQTTNVLFFLGTNNVLFSRIEVSKIF